MALDCCDCAAPCSAELAAMEEFIALLAKGKEPPVEVFLKQHAEFAASLRPVLEAALEVNHRFRVLKARCPGLDATRLLSRLRTRRQR